MKKGLVSIIIVNWNGKDHLEKCIPSVLKNSYQNFEIIVIDNGSTDGSIEYLRLNFSFIKLIRNKSNLGFAEANNQGIDSARGEYVLFLNNDTKVEKNFLSILVTRLSKDDKMGACQPKILHWEKPGKLDSIGSFLMSSGFLYHFGFEANDTGKLNKEIKLFSGKGSCLLIKKLVLDEIGNFDKDFFAYFEETDLCWRLWLAGYYLLYIPSSVIHHKTWGTSRRLTLGFVTYHSFKNRISSLITNLEIVNLAKILPWHLLICFFIALSYLIWGKPQNSLAIMKAIYWNVKNLKHTLKKRTIVQEKIRRLPDSKLFPIILKDSNISYYWYILRYSFIRSKVFKKSRDSSENSFLSLKYRPKKPIFNKSYAFFDTSYNNFKTLNYHLENWQIGYLKRIFENLKLTKDDVFLDIGSGGYGWVVIETVRSGVKQSVGIDISDPLVKRASEMAIDTLPVGEVKRCRFIPADVQKLPFRNSTFNKVSAVAVLEHVKNFKKAVDEIRRVTKKDGLVYICVPNSYENTPLLMKFINHLNDEKVEHFHHFDPYQLAKVFEKNGFLVKNLIFHAHDIKLLQWLVTYLIPFVNRNNSKIWWFFERIDNLQSKYKKSMNFSLVLRRL